MNWNRRSFILSTIALLVPRRFQKWHEFTPTEETCRKIDTELRRNNASVGRTTCYFNDVPFELKVRRNVVAVQRDHFDELERRFGSGTAHCIIEALVDTAIDHRQFVR